MDKRTFNKLIDKYLDGTASPQEKALLDEYAEELARIEMVTILPEEEAQLKEEMYQNILTVRSLPDRKVVPLYRHTWFRVAAAAVIILIVTAGVYLSFFKSNSNQPIARKEQTIKQDIAPGKNGAVLTLADGSIVVLDSTGNGILATQGNVKVVKNSNGEISYQVDANSEKLIANSPTYNTLTTDRGKQFHVKLPDGTDVWLNSASSLRYPTAFAGKERRVEVTGEAYFEVAHDASKPFHVVKGETDVTVLGTHFNVNAYEDEDALRVTLLEGSVKVSPAGGGDLRNSPNYKRPGVDNSITIKPGEQAIVKPSSLSVTHNVNVSDVVAWKNGFFSFRGTDVKGIMRQLSRWYDVDVVYQGVDPEETFTGKIDRSLTLSQVLKVLEETKVHYRIEDGKKLVILP